MKPAGWIGLVERAIVKYSRRAIAPRKIIAAMNTTPPSAVIAIAKTIHGIATRIRFSVSPLGPLRRRGGGPFCSPSRGWAALSPPNGSISNASSSPNIGSTVRLSSPNIRSASSKRPFLPPSRSPDSIALPRPEAAPARLELL